MSGVQLFTSFLELVGDLSLQIIELLKDNVSCNLHNENGGSFCQTFASTSGFTSFSSRDCNVRIVSETAIVSVGLEDNTDGCHKCLICQFYRTGMDERKERGQYTVCVRACFATTDSLFGVGSASNRLASCCLYCC